MSSWQPNAQGEIAVDWYVIAPFLMATLFLLMTPGPVMAIVAHNTLRDGATGGLKTAIATVRQWRRDRRTAKEEARPGDLAA